MITPPEAQDLKNDFHVMLYNGELVPLRAIDHMTPAQGIELAARIVDLVDPTREEFDSVLEALQSS